MAEYSALYGTARYGESYYGLVIIDLSETITIAESLSRLLTYVRSINETLSVSESVERLSVHVRGVSETISASEDLSVLLRALMEATFTVLAKKPGGTTIPTKPSASITLTDPKASTVSKDEE